MQNTKLVQLLRSLNPHELKQFKDFVTSPVYNKNKHVAGLYEALRKYYPDFSNPKLTDENIFKIIFPGESYNYFKIRNISSDLFSLGKEFLIFLSQQNDKFHNHRDIFLLSQLRDRNLDLMFEQAYKFSKEELENSGIKDDLYFYENHLLADERSSFIAPRDANTNMPLLQESFDNFVKFLLIKLLKYYDVMLHEKKQNNFPFDMKLLDEVLAYIKNNSSEDNPTLLIYYNIILLEKEKNETYFFKLKKLKDLYFDQLERKDQYMLFLHMAGFCAYVFNDLCKDDFMNEHFLLSKENFERGTIKLGHIIYMDFLNHVKIAIRVNEFDWAEKYISTFKDMLYEEKECTLNFCYGYINYKKGNLDKALDLLSKANFPNFLIKVQVKILLLEIYYEKEFYEQALSMIDTFRHYLNREKSFKENFKESFYEFLKLTNELIKLKTSAGKKDYDIKKLANDIEGLKSNQFGIKMWLRENMNRIS